MTVLLLAGLAIPAAGGRTAYYASLAYLSGALVSFC